MSWCQHAWPPKDDGRRPPRIDAKHSTHLESLGHLWPFLTQLFRKVSDGISKLHPHPHRIPVNVLHLKRCHALRPRSSLWTYDVVR